MELKTNEFALVESLFDELKHHISIKGLIHGYVNGRMFADDKYTSAVALTPQGIFLGGDPHNDPFFIDMNRIIKEDILPECSEKGKLDYVVFYPQNNTFNNALELMFYECYTMKDSRMTFSHDMTDIDNALSQDIFPVDREMLSHTDMPGLESVIEEILEGWPSLDEFIERGFGCVAIVKGNLAGWCLTDWVVGDECEIGIETYPEFRRQGYGRKMASGVLSLAGNRGIKRTGWQCWYSNEGSRATAMSVGFKMIQEFTVHFAWTDPLNTMLINGNYYMLGKKQLNILPDYARSAWSYAQSLDKNWDWGGSSYLYWNCACMYFKSGQPERAGHYFKLAVEKGWKGIGDIKDHSYFEYVYKDADAERISEELSVFK